MLENLASLIFVKNRNMSEQELIDIIDAWENLPLMIELTAKNEANYSLLVHVALYNQSKYSWRAAYLVDKINDLHPGLLLPYIEAMIQQLKKEDNSSKKRHFLKLISQHSIPEKFYGFLIEYCLEVLSSAKEPPAVRVHAMQILYQISEVETDLKPELLLVIEHEMEFHATAGILARGRKLVTKLRKQI